MRVESYRNTEVIKIDRNYIDSERIRFAAGVIKRGGTVAFPTETVYGLGANALDAAAVERIFQAKGRPGDNPLIVHLAQIDSVYDIAAFIPPKARLVMQKFWPGPVTVILKKSAVIPDLVTAGLYTVAVRVPSHPVAVALIKESGLPVAAPSANISGRPSPTLASHVIEDLYGRVDVIIDSGSTDVGLESTVIDMTSEIPVILRPGGITPSQLKEVLGDVDIDSLVLEKMPDNLSPRSPGMKYTHYSPKAGVIVVRGEIKQMVEKIMGLADEFEQSGSRVGILATDQTRAFYNHTGEVFGQLRGIYNQAGGQHEGERRVVISAGDRDCPQTIAASLFAIFRMFDEAGVDVVLAEGVDGSEIGLAIMNRMNKAAGYNIIDV